MPEKAITDTTVADSDITGTDPEPDTSSTADHDSDSGCESGLWDHFNFPELTPEEDAQLTIALQGGTPQSTTSIETSSTIGHHEATDYSSRMRSGVLGPTVQFSPETRVH